MSESLTAEAASFNSAAQAAYTRAAERSGKSLTRLAADMGVSETTLRRYVTGAMRWSLDGVLALAAASGQDPIDMLSLSEEGRRRKAEGASDG